MEIKGLKFSTAPQHHFASDNNSPAHADVMGAIVAANQGHALAYGADYYTERAKQKFLEVFGDQCTPYFLFTGTGANVLSIASLTRSYHAVICAATAHLNGAECGAPEKFADVKLIAIPTQTGKIRVADIEACFAHQGDQHHSQPKVVSLTQSTDLGNAYTIEEVAEICDFAHQRNMFVHMDGARIYNACAAEGASLKEMTTDAGVDVLSLGGTKNGLLGAEAVVFLNPKLGADFKFLRKQGMQLASKMRFLAVQLETLLSNDLWLRNARKANQMARLLADGLEKIPGVSLSRKVQTNMVYCILPAQSVEQIRAQYLFYVFDENRSEARLVTNYDTSEEDVQGFLNAVRNAVG